MSILDISKDFEKWKTENSKVSPEKYFIQTRGGQTSGYVMTDKEMEVRRLILRHFALGDVTLQKPRVEFNDMSVIQRAQYDEMSWNTYQPNNGEPAEQDAIGGWKSNAIRPVVRNKIISIAAHSTARLIFPKVFAYNQESEVQEKAARVMEYLMEWSGNQSNYTYTALNRVIAALVYPASIGYTEYAEVYRPIPITQEDGSIKEEMVLDEQLSGFQDTPVPVDQLFIENFYEPDIQKQGWLLWRRVRSYSLLESIYRSKYPNFAFVNPGVQLIYNDANQLFYSVYDTNLRPEMCEEIIYWNRGLGIKIIMVNGVMLTPYNNPNPRIDHLYPFDKFGFEIINTRCFYYKSAAFKMQPDANVVNSLYPMIIDGTYLNLMPPMVNSGPDSIGSDVVVPGLVTTLTSPDSKLVPIQTSNNLTAGYNALERVEESIKESTTQELPSGKITAYNMSRIEQEKTTLLGLFVQMIVEHVRQYGKLRISDILQHLTIADVDKITDDTDLVFKTFLLPAKGKEKNRTIKFDINLPQNLTKEEHLKESYKILGEENEGLGEKTLIKVNPELFRELKFMVAQNPDILNPRSEDLEKAYKLEAYDRLIANPLADQEEVLKEFLLGAYPEVRDPERFISKKPVSPTENLNKPINTNQSPLAMMAGANALPQQMATRANI